MFGGSTVKKCKVEENDKTGTANYYICKVTELWCKYHSEVIFLQSSSSPFLSLQTQSALSVTLRRFIGIELHDEESSVSLSRSIGVE